ncbi:hypothetical protein SAY86_007077 [Trapa natans]|uniref:Uncharacterized protein n=1 Tax=Trapa natans TaxID=22666 RepID=A0AAN7R1S4_TRANT|nr:hypothetical protein SAY86_007077 [Trapa natans]
MQSIVSCGQRGSKVNDIDASDRSSLTLSETFCISVASFIGLDDEDIWNAIFKGKNEIISRLKPTDFAHGFHFGALEYLCAKEDDMNMLEGLFPFPTLIPYVQVYLRQILLQTLLFLTIGLGLYEELPRTFMNMKLVTGVFPVSQHLHFQKNSTLPAIVLLLIQEIEPENTPLPVAVMQECFVVYIKQVDFIGKQILSKLILDWRPMDELAVLRAIYLLG